VDLRDGYDGAEVLEAAGTRPSPDTGPDPHSRMEQELNTYIQNKL
jgi:hypothetical protein